MVHIETGEFERPPILVIGEQAQHATAAAHALVAVIALVAGLEPTLPADGFFVAAWVASALLFRQAAADPAEPPQVNRDPIR